jgi:nitronate monooxygenase
MIAERIRHLMRRPIVIAPMGGGPSNPALVVAAADAGALGILAAPYKTAEVMVAEIGAVRKATSEAFGVNVFVPGKPTDQPGKLGRYVASLARDAVDLGIDLGDPVWDDDDWAAKISALLADPPPIVSFTFGCPPREIVDEFRAAGSVVAITITCPSEASLAADAGADCLCVQGAEAGAHRGMFTNGGAAPADLDLGALIAEVACVTDLPQIAAGGIMNASAVTEVLRAGAIAAQCGTAFLRCPESGAHPAHKAALADGRFTSTALTRAFSGRPARGLVNQFMADHPDAIAAYPEINNATRPLRAAAAKAGDVDRMSLWAGSGFKEAAARPAGEIVEQLWPQRQGQ